MYGVFNVFEWKFSKVKYFFLQIQIKTNLTYFHKKNLKCSDEERIFKD